MKWRVQSGDREFLLDLRRNGRLTHYSLNGDLTSHGAVSIEEIAPGMYSVLEGNRSFTVRLMETPGSVEAWIGLRRVTLALSDPRDRPAQAKGTSAAGPQQIRALMPGKVIKVLVSVGEEVKAGTGLIVVEAMKMQNEMKTLKGGRVIRIHAAEGATVGPGEPLVEIG
jgi:biotin carboxyl carrier protein